MNKFVFGCFTAQKIFYKSETTTIMYILISYKNKSGNNISCSKTLFTHDVHNIKNKKKVNIFLTNKLSRGHTKEIVHNRFSS